MTTGPVMPPQRTVRDEHPALKNQFPWGAFLIGIALGSGALALVWLLM